MVIDFHTHCFSDKIADKAMERLTAISQYRPHTPGTLKGLKESMARAGIDVSVVLNIATNPGQVANVNNWAIESNREEGIVSFGSVHPEYKDFKAEIKRLSANGVRGLKFHPDYQKFFVDEKEYFPIYEAAACEGLIMQFHCGKDLGLRDVLHCTPERFIKVVNAFPGAVIIGAHLGGQGMWDEVFAHLIGKEVYLDTSFGFKFMTQAEIDRVLDGHNTDKILFATDAPWQDQKTEAEEMREFVSDKALLDKILYKNAARLLGLKGV